MAAVIVKSPQATIGKRIFSLDVTEQNQTLNVTTHALAAGLYRVSLWVACTVAGDPGDTLLSAGITAQSGYPGVVTGNTIAPIMTVPLDVVNEARWGTIVVKVAAGYPILIFATVNVEGGVAGKYALHASVEKL